MKCLPRKRGSGKTTALVFTSAATGYPIVVANNVRKQYVKDLANRVHFSIPEPIIMSECIRGRVIKGVLIDDVEEVIQAYATEHFHAPVISCTLTVDEEGVPYEHST